MRVDKGVYGSCMMAEENENLVVGDEAAEGDVEYHRQGSLNFVVDYFYAMIWLLCIAPIYLWW